MTDTLDTYAETIAANLNDPRATMRTAVAVGRALALPGVVQADLVRASSLAAARAAHPDADADTLTLLAQGKTYGVSPSTIGRYSLTYDVIIAAGISTRDADAFRHAWAIAKAGKGKGAKAAAAGWRAQPEADRARLLADYALTGIRSKSETDVRKAAEREAAQAQRDESAATEAIAEGITVSPAMVTPSDILSGTDWSAIVAVLVARAQAAGEGATDDLYAALTDGQDAIIAAATAGSLVAA